MPGKVSLKARKKLLEATLEQIVMAARPRQRIALAEHIHNIGLELIGHMHGVDTQNAVVFFPDDATARLIQTIAQHEQMTGIEHEQICDNLIAKLTEVNASQLN